MSAPPCESPPNNKRQIKVISLTRHHAVEPTEAASSAGLSFQPPGTNDMLVCALTGASAQCTAPVDMSCSTCRRTLLCTLWRPRNGILHVCWSSQTTSCNPPAELVLLGQPPLKQPSLHEPITGRQHRSACILHVLPLLQPRPRLPNRKPPPLPGTGLLQHGRPVSVGGSSMVNPMPPGCPCSAEHQVLLVTSCLCGNR